MRSRKIKFITWIFIIAVVIIKTYLTLTFPPPAEATEVDFALRFGFFNYQSLRLFGLAILGLTAYFFSKLVLKYLDRKRSNSLILVISFLFYFLSPWTNYVATFQPVLNLILLIIVFLLSRFPKKVALISVVCSLGLIYFLTKTLPDNVFIKSLSPAKIGEEINERQKIDFLATGKTYMLPPLFRKLIYNKPYFIFNKSLNQLVSLLDFEQTASPLDSYSLTKLSSLSPKGNPPLLLIIEIPLVGYGIYTMFNSQKRYGMFKYLIVFTALILPYFVMEKKILAQSAILFIPLIIHFEIIAINQIVSSKQFTNKILFITLLIIYLYSQTSFNNLFYRNYSAYQWVHPQLYREIADYLSSVQANGTNIIVTNRFGSTDKFTRFYLKNKLRGNVTFSAFDLRNTKPEANTIYIGLPGEFVGRGKNLEDKSLPANFELINKIPADEEPVFEYGKGLWIGKLI